MNIYRHSRRTQEQLDRDIALAKKQRDIEEVSIQVKRFTLGYGLPILGLLTLLLLSTCIKAHEVNRTTPAYIPKQEVVVETWTRPSYNSERNTLNQAALERKLIQVLKELHALKRGGCYE